MFIVRAFTQLVRTCDIRTALGVLVLAVAVAGASTEARAQYIIYVDGDAPVDGDGSAWEYATKHLSTALDRARVGDEIWVAEGTYIPQGSGPEATFQLKSGVKVLGGFAGDETDRDERDPDRNVTVLSGDRSMDDANGRYSDNSYHVVTSSGTTRATVLDGFTISGGRAGMLTSDNTVGGGMLNDGGSPTIRDCIFQDNRSTHGGAGMANINESRPLIVRTAFLDNTGGGMLNDNSAPDIRRGIFKRNTTLQEGGGMLNTNRSEPTVLESTFEANVARNGHGGGIANINSSIRIQNSHFFGNAAPRGNGGAVSSLRSDIDIIGSAFVGNRSGRGGGGAISNNRSNARMLNIVATANEAYSVGGAIVNVDGYTDIINSILWQNTSRFPHQVINLEGATTRVMASAIQHSGGSGETYWEARVGTDEGGNIAQGPGFVRSPDAGRDGTWGTLDDDYGDLRVRSGSPVLDAGAGGYLDLDSDGRSFDDVPSDLYGLARIQGGAVDMGAYEGTAHYTSIAGAGRPATFEEAGVLLAFDGTAASAEVMLTRNPIVEREGEDVAAMLDLPDDLDLVLPATWDIELRDEIGTADAEVCFSMADGDEADVPGSSTVYKRPLRAAGAWAAQETVVRETRGEICAVRVRDGAGEYAVLEEAGDEPIIAATPSTSASRAGEEGAAGPRDRQARSASKPSMGTGVAGDMEAYEALHTGDEPALEAIFQDEALGTTFVRYYIPFETDVHLTLRDALGRTVATLVKERQAAGIKNIYLKDLEVNSGVYILRLEAGEDVLTRRLTLDQPSSR